MKQRKDILFALIIGVMVWTLLLPLKAEAAPANSGYTETEWEVLKLTNRERYNMGLNPYLGFPLLQSACDIREKEISVYYSHTRPNGAEPWTAFDEVGLVRSAAGENIAAGYGSPEAVIYAWMLSEGHRANILDAESRFGFKYMGAGFASNPNTYYQNFWVQMFLSGGTLSGFQLVAPASNIYIPGTTIEDMDIYATVNSSKYGTCYLPILPEYCTGYDANKTGKQTITVSVLGYTGTYDVQVVEPIPEKPYKITNTVSGVHVYWKAVEGTDTYYVWRSETGVNGTYGCIEVTNELHYKDTNVTSGKTYYYKVSCWSKEQNKDFSKSEPLGIIYVGTPDLTLRVNRANGIGLGWNAIQGATGYAIYRKPYSGNSAWVRVATITNPSTLTWDDTSVKAENGTIYRYTVRALAGSKINILSGCRSTGRTMVRLTSRSLNSATKTSATSIKCAWSTSTQATGYEVRFMVGNTVYKTYTIGNYKTGVKTFTNLKAGQTYKIQVRTYKKVDGVGSFYSAWSTAKTVTL